MKTLLLILALLCLSPLARGQSTYPVASSNGGNITATNAACIPTACVGIGLSSSFSAVITVGVTGTFSATLAVEESQDGGTTWTSAGTSLTSTGTTSYVIAGFTNFRVRASAYASGNAGVNLQVSNAPSGSVTSGTADPTGNTCTANQLFVQTTTGNLYSCNAGTFAKVGPSAGGAVSITATAPIVVTPSPTTGAGVISAPTVVTSAAALTNNAVVLGAGSQGEQTVAGITTNGVNEIDVGTNGGAAGVVGLNGSTSGKITLTANGTASQLIDNVGFQATVLTATSQIQGFGKTIWTSTVPTIATGGCGGSGATISNGGGNVVFDINVGTGPTSAGCTITFPANSIGWVVSCNDQTTQSATVFVQKQTGAVSTTSATIQTFAATGSANAPTASDVYHCTAAGH